MVTETQLHSETLGFGRHRDLRWVNVPVSYLRWMVNSGHSRAEFAIAELSRRGIADGDLPELEVSGHAIDRASLRCRKTWHETRGEDEGLHAWLLRICADARRSDPVKREGTTTRYRHLGLKLVFEEGERWAVLKTVNPG